MLYYDSKEVFTINSIKTDDLCLRKAYSYSFYIVLHKDGFEIEDKCFKIYLQAPTRDEALVELEEELIFLWQNYVQDENKKLSKDALRLKENLMYYFHEVKQ